MSRYFFEIEENVKLFDQTSRYWWIESEIVGWNSLVNLIEHSERVWEEDGEKLRYIKVKSVRLSDMSNVDPKEFVWVKLQACEIRGS